MCFEQDVCGLCIMHVHTQTYLCSMYVCRSCTYVCVHMCSYVDIMFTHSCMDVFLTQAGMIGFITLQQSAPSQMTFLTHSLVLQRISANTIVCLMLFVCTWMHAYVFLRAHKYAYTRMHCIVSNPHVRIYVSLNVFVYTCMQTSIYVCKLTNMHTYTHACIGRCTYAYTHDASLSLRVPAQGSLIQSADDAA
jgi:hypothetical protein